MSVLTGGTEIVFVFFVVRRPLAHVSGAGGSLASREADWAHQRKS